MDIDEGTFEEGSALIERPSVANAAGAGSVDGRTAVLVLDPYGVIESVNAGAESLTGYGRDELVGTHFSRLYPEQDVSRGRPREQLKTADTEGVFEATETRVTRDGKGVELEVRINALRTAGGELKGFVKELAPPAKPQTAATAPSAVREEVPPGGELEGWELERAEENLERVRRLYAVLSRATAATVGIHEPDALYTELCRVMVEEGGYLMAWIGMVDPDSRRVTPAAQWGDDSGYLQSVSVSSLEIPEGLGPTGTAVREGRCVVCDDFEKDPKVVTAREQALERGYRSNAAFPLRLADQVVGALTIYAGDPQYFDIEQLRLLESLAENISFAIEAIDREEKRRQAEESQRSSEEYFRSLIENVQDVIVVVDTEGRIQYASPSIERVLGYKRSELRDAPMFDLMEESYREAAADAVQTASSRTGKPVEWEFHALHRDGASRAFAAVGMGYIDARGSTAVVINARDVTVRKQFDEDLRQSEETANAILNALSDSAGLIEPDGTVLAVNETGASRLGMTTAEVIGKNLYDLDAEQVSERRKEAVDEVVSTRRPASFEEEVDGTFNDVSFFPILDKGGRVSKLAVLLQDVTDRRRAEEAQRKDRDFVSAVVNTTGALVVVLDREGRIILFNSTCEETTGYSADEVRGKAAWELLVPPEETERFKAGFERLVSGDYPSASESRWLTKHGASRLIAWSNTVLFEDGGAVGFVIGTGIDVTERRKAEEALKESEEQYRTIFESTGTAMCIIGEDATIAFMNQEFERMTGHEADHVEGRMKFMELLLPEEVESFEEYHREAMRARRNVPVHFECRVSDRRGNVIHAFANMGHIPGRTTSVVSLIDITREKVYEQDLQETAQRLRHFLTVASHELRHPITIVKGYANTLNEYMDTMPKDLISEILFDIDNSTDRLTRYVDELMDVSRVEEGHFPVEKQSVEAERYIEMALEDMQVMGTETPFNVSIDPGAGTLDVDPDKFVQLLDILLENAVKFSPPDSQVDIDVKRDESGQLEVSVMDRGIGIAEEHAEKVFDRFYQVEDELHHSKPGIGLGLYIAREIVTAHGGRIWCEPREGGGTVFTFTVG